MMDEYVTKEQVIDWYRPYGQTDEPIPFETLVSDLRDMKAADVAPVRHGRWIWHSEERGYLCSECGSGCLLNYESDWHKSDWCPHCGAKMEGDDHA